MDETLRDLIEIIHFTENVSAKIHGLLDEAEIYRAVKEEFGNSKRYAASILLLTDDESWLRIVESSLAPEKLRAGEKVAGVRLKEYKIDLSKSSVFSQVVREGKTPQVNVSDIVGQLLPRPLAYLISKTMGYEKKPCILTPLTVHGKIIGVFAMSSTEFAGYFIPSVRNLAQHISTALELAHEHVQRRQAEEELREHRDHLEELVEERTAELTKASEQLQREIAERKQVEEALRESEQKYRTLVGQSLQGLAVIQDFHIVFANTAFAEICGCTVEELLSLSPAELQMMVHPEDQAFVWGRFSDRLEGKPVPPRYEYRGVRKDGTVRWLEMYASRIEYGGKPAIQGAIADITERKMAEKALEHRAAQLATVNEIGQQIASILDPDELLRQIANLLESAFGYRFVYILLLDQACSERSEPNAGELVIRASAGPGRVLEGTRLALESRSINTCVARTGKPLLANDVAREPMYLHLEEVADTKSELTVPIKVKDKVIGTLDVQSTELNAFDASDLFTLQALANQAGIAIENARLYGETSHRLDELSTIHEVTMAATSTMDFDQALERAVDAIHKILNFKVFGFLMLDESTGKLHLHPSYRGVSPEVAEKLDLHVGMGITGWVAQTGQPLLVPDVSQDRRYLDGIAGIRAEMCVPLKIGNRVIGVIDVENDQANGFSEDNLRLLSTLAGQLATTIENAHLFAETKRNANDLALLLGTSTAISSTLDLDQILETVAHQITTSLVATFCRITLLDETGNNLVIRATSPIRDKTAEDGFGRRYPLAIAPWHRQVVETAEPVLLRHDVPELALSEEERRIALTEEVKSAALMPLIVGGRVLGVISLGEERSWERSPFTEEKVGLCQSIAAQAAVAIENARLYEKLQQSFIQTIAALAAAVEAKDPYTGGHSQRTMELAAAIAQELELGSEEVELIRYACLLHDVGKIGVSEQILLKPGPLDAQEWDVVRRHPTLGASIVERAALLQKLVPIIQHHHERYDGSGYPAGLGGEVIPLAARILAVADAYEAMTSDRAYRPAMTVEQALATLQEGADKQWDGKIVCVLHKLIREQGHLA